MQRARKLCIFLLRGLKFERPLHLCLQLSFWGFLETLSLSSANQIKFTIEAEELQQLTARVETNKLAVTTHFTTSQLRHN